MVNSLLNFVATVSLGTSCCDNSTRSANCNVCGPEYLTNSPRFCWAEGTHCTWPKTPATSINKLYERFRCQNRNRASLTRTVSLDISAIARRYRLFLSPDPLQTLDRCNNSRKRCHLPSSRCVFFESGQATERIEDTLLERYKRAPNKPRKNKKALSRSPQSC